MCVLWPAVSFLRAYRGKGKVSFQISRLDSEAGVGPISLCYYCCTLMFAAFLVMNGSIVVGMFTGVMGGESSDMHNSRLVRCVWSLLHTSLLNQ